MGALSMQDHHAARFAAAVATISSKPWAGKLAMVLHADGRRSWPQVVRYRVKRWSPAAGLYVPAELVDLPPTAETHPDEFAAEAARASNKPVRPTSLPYEVNVLNLAAYEWLAARGWLLHGHLYPPADAPAAIDNRTAPGA